MLHDTPGNWQSTLRINDKLALTTSKDILEAMGEGRGPRNVIVTLGYAGWDQGQLEHEMTENTWLTVPASEHILFDLPPEERLPAAMALLGVDYASLVENAGHALGGGYTGICSSGYASRIRFWHQTYRRRGRQHAVAPRQPVDHDQ